MHYREAFYACLLRELEAAGVEIVVYYARTGIQRPGSREPHWATGVQAEVVRIGGRRATWMSLGTGILHFDAIIVEGGISLLNTFPLAALCRVTDRPIVFWGHGNDFQRSSDPFTFSAARRGFVGLPGWWFAYNSLSARALSAAGFDAERVISVNNANDTTGLRSACETIGAHDRRRLRDGLGLSGAAVGLFVGGMYRRKRLPFLLEACDLIRREVPEFEMLFVGDGPDRCLVQAQARKRSWMRDLGPRFGPDRVDYFALSHVMLVPGLVGLCVLDSFATETPLVTTAVPYHSPEIAYLRNGVNGLMLSDPDDVEGYARNVAAVLTNPDLRSRLRAGCRDASHLYSAEKMARRFARGIVAVLEERYGWRPR